MRFSSVAVTLLIAPVVLLALSTMAQTEYARPTEGVLLPSPSRTEVDDATALSINPANLGFLESWSIVYAGAWVNQQTHLAGQGHGFFFAFPAGPFGLGLGTEFLLPPQGVRDWQGLDRRGRLSLGLSLNPVRALGLGMAYRTFPGYDLGDRIHTLDLALTIRPVNHLNFVFSLEDVNRPDITYGSVQPTRRTQDGDAFTLPGRTEQAPRRFSTAVTLRPFGTDRFAVGTELHYLYGTTRRFDPMAWQYEDRTTQSTDIRGILSWMITDGLTLRTRFSAEGLRSNTPTAYHLDLALIMDSLRFPLGITASPYVKLAPDDHRGFEGMSWTIRLSGDQPPALPILAKPYYVVPIAIENRMNSHDYFEFLAELERIEFDPSVNMLLLTPETGALPLAQAFEINRRIGALKAAGIRTTCYLRDADTAGYLACAAADQIWIHPAGGIRLSGLSMTSLHFKNLLDRLGVTADIVQIGEYKSAPETLTRAAPSDPAMEAVNRYLDSNYNRLIAAISEGRKLDSVQNTKRIIETGPFIAPETITLQLADRIVHLDQIAAEIETDVQAPVYIDKRYGNRALRQRSYLDTPAIAVLHIEGDLVEGDSFHLSPLGIHMTGAKTVQEQIQTIRETPSIRAVVVRIDSPGGSALAADIIWRELMVLRETTPVIASMGSVAASGGYYIASAANLIYAEPTTLTGSIGVFYGKADISGLLEKLGITSTVHTRGNHSDMESWLRTYTEEEREKLTKQLQSYYDLFLDRVVEGRGHGLTRDILDRRARGRIWSGADARQQLLVDRIGGFQSALNYARAVGFVSRNTPVSHYPQRRRGVVDLLMQRMGGTRETTVDLLALTPETRDTLKAALPFTMAEHKSPRARLPFVLLEAP